jgi:acetate kinase
MNQATILVINCGSSSIKFSLFDLRSERRLIEGLAEKLGGADAQLHWQTPEAKGSLPLADDSHTGAMAAITGRLAPLLNAGLEIIGVGHRVVHGGEAFQASVALNSPVIAAIEACNHLAPLHNPANLLGIRTAQALFPDVPQVAVFDTAFHQNWTPNAYLYAVPYDLYTAHSVRRYGFHGTSHRYVAAEAARLLGQPYETSALISAHLGNGCSATAVLNGRSVDSTMGLTPLEGLVMGTRSGDIDPGLQQYLTGRLGCSLDEVMRILNKDSGLLGVSGLSNDMRTLLDAAKSGHQRAQLAIDLFCYRLAKAIAALTVPLGRLDALVFTGGIGEHAAPIRQQVVAQLALLGLTVEATRNAAHGRASGRLISPAGVAPAVLVVPTDEELMIARDTAALVPHTGS